jgi:hypothetical protein
MTRFPLTRKGGLDYVASISNQADEHMNFTRDAEGIYTASSFQSHRSDEYQETGFDTLLDMQAKHFWYVGRHRFILSAMKKNSDLKKNICHRSRGWMWWVDKLSSTLLAKKIY